MLKVLVGRLDSVFGAKTSFIQIRDYFLQFLLPIGTH